MKPDAEREAIISHLVALLKKQREDRGLSMNETAWRAGLDHSMILRVEKRQRLPTIETLLRMSDALEADLPALLAAAVESVRGTRPGTNAKLLRPRPSGGKAAGKRQPRTAKAATKKSAS
ncbi:putative transcriptional regulator with C-terminal CBS domains [Opitutaceae bacterium TAV1]|nr:transcriptional regulator [Opitutaceae bacterium TAV5]EIQ01414.1 putative transcriptional regulator with C-terminal CBS domains [Opitutaceae bacterium TAV1]EIQ01442.1 putative transcriptional regulator with C-terminal CBS domains [Opitutaceae bacterium TAV1]